MKTSQNESCTFISTVNDNWNMLVIFLVLFVETKFHLNEENLDVFYIVVLCICRRKQLPGLYVCETHHWLSSWQTIFCSCDEFNNSVPISGPKSSYGFGKTWPQKEFYVFWVQETCMVTLVVVPCVGTKATFGPMEPTPQSPRIFPRISTIPKTRPDRGWGNLFPLSPSPLSLCQWKTISFSYFGNYETDRKWSCLLRTRSKVEGKMLRKKRFNSTTGELNRTCLRSLFDTGITPVHVACILQQMQCGCCVCWTDIQHSHGTDFVLS